MRTNEAKRTQYVKKRKDKELAESDEEEVAGRNRSLKSREPKILSESSESGASEDSEGSSQSEDSDESKASSGIWGSEDIIEQPEVDESADSDDPATIRQELYATYAALGQEPGYKRLSSAKILQDPLSMSVDEAAKELDCECNPPLKVIARVSQQPGSYGRSFFVCCKPSEMQCK